MPSRELTPDGIPESLAVALLRHLEWQPDSFSVVFLFSDVGPALTLGEWLTRRRAPEDATLQRREPADHFVTAPEAWLDQLLAELPSLSIAKGPLWLVLHGHPADSQWNRARRRFLARLNERRFLLERDLHRPLVLVLPVPFKDEARHMAPDLWHVRAFSEELRARPALPIGDSRAVARPDSSPITLVAEAMPVAATPKFDEWERTVVMSRAQVFLPTAWRSIDELLAAGRSADAAQVAEQAVALARGRAAAAPGDTSVQRELSMSLDQLGAVAQALGDWVQAEAAYRESLEISRQLVVRVGGTPESLRDLSISLDNVGAVARIQGDWPQTEAAYRESLALRRQLVGRLGNTPESMRDLSISLDNVGAVAWAQSAWSRAEAAYEESLAIRRQLVDRLGGTPEALRDVSVALDNVGAVAQAQGDWARAEAAYRESMEISRQRIEGQGGTSEALRDMSIAFDNLGAVAQAQGDWMQAEVAYRQGLEIRRQLVEQLGGTPEALRELLVSLDRMGVVAQAQGDWVHAEAACREGLEIARQMVERLGGTPEVLRDLSVALNNVGAVTQAQGAWAQAEAAYREMLGISRQLAERHDATPQALDDLAVSLTTVSNLPDLADEDRRALKAEALAIRQNLASTFSSVTRYRDALQALEASAAPQNSDADPEPTPHPST